MRPRIFALAIAACGLACRSSTRTAERSEPQPAATHASPAPNAPAPAPEVPLWSLPARWREMSDLAFERAIDGWYSPAGPRRLAPADLAALETALDGGDGASVRAAVLLARTQDPRAGEVLLKRLEKRVAAPSDRGGADAADVVAAAAFAQGLSAVNAAVRLASLGAGKRPHHDLAVRVECACSSLLLGRDEPIPYLLQLLRIGTSQGRTLGPDDSPEEVAWVQARAAAALSARAGTDRRFLPEASVRDREQETARLESLLPGAPEKKR